MLSSKNHDAGAYLGGVTIDRHHLDAIGCETVTVVKYHLRNVIRKIFHSGPAARPRPGLTEQGSATVAARVRGARPPGPVIMTIDMIFNECGRIGTTFSTRR